jgi:TatD DNase family protein
MMFDTHCHLNHPDLAPDLVRVIARAHDVGVREMLVVGYDLPSSREAVRLANEIDGVWAAVGFHPHDAKLYDNAAEAEIRGLAQEPRVVAIGEIGLDFYRDLSPREVQARVFERQLALAQEVGKPVVLHHRDSREEAYRILAGVADGMAGCIVHCFNDSAEWVHRWLDLGFVIGIAGPVTYKRNDRLRELVAGLPRDRILIETDCPYLAPHPYRGKRNEPAYLTLVAEEVARCWSSNVEAVAHATTATAHRILGL